MVEQITKMYEISIHALREESDCSRSGKIVSIYLFQSTLSVRRATLDSSRVRGVDHYFNPRSP